MSGTRILLLPGWRNSGPDHWQSRWEALHGDVRVEQHDWLRPLRGDWMAQLEQAVLASAVPVALVAHSMGCLLVAAWAAHSRHTARVRAALLVAPADLEREDLRHQLPGWQPIERRRLPFPALLIGSQDDPYCDFGRAQSLAADWGAAFVDKGRAGHINA
ncbi:MAG: alpha/beta hydrolase [Variovorax sp.]|nr:alpha/beta hydrolase [Variovorax sp.]